LFGCLLIAIAIGLTRGEAAFQPIVQQPTAAIKQEITIKASPAQQKPFAVDSVVPVNRGGERGRGRGGERGRGREGERKITLPISPSPQSWVYPDRTFDRGITDRHFSCDLGS
jgi:hypothetical protein